MPSMPRMSEMKGASFDGRNMGYAPPKKLSVSKKLKLHTRRAEKIDPITYEVVRHSLWHVNEEHGATIQRLSGSPVAMYALDLNPSILAEDGEFVYFGPYMQYMSGVTDTQVKWILEYRSQGSAKLAATSYSSNSSGCTSPSTVAPDTRARTPTLSRRRSSARLGQGARRHRRRRPRSAHRIAASPPRRNRNPDTFRR